MYKASSELVQDEREDVLDCFDKNLPHILAGWWDAGMWSAGVALGWRAEEKRSHVSPLEM